MVFEFDSPSEPGYLAEIVEFVCDFGDCGTDDSLDVHVLVWAHFISYLEDKKLTWSRADKKTLNITAMVMKAKGRALG